MDGAWTHIDGMWVESGYRRRLRAACHTQAIRWYGTIQAFCLIAVLHAIVFGLLVKYF
jgi:hypothetical protein